MILRELAEMGARVRWASRPQKAVITVPAYFSDAQRKRHARGRRAGRAGSGAHPQRAHRRQPGLWLRATARAHTVLVYDLGGGTFDVSVVHGRRRRDGGAVQPRQQPAGRRRLRRSAGRA